MQSKQKQNDLPSVETLLSGVALRFLTAWCVAERARGAGATDRWCMLLLSDLFSFFDTAKLLILRLMLLAELVLGRNWDLDGDLSSETEFRSVAMRGFRG